MLLRFFLFIWGSILLTVAVVVVLVTQLNLGPPQDQRADMIRPVAQSVLRGAYLRGGEAELRAVMADSADLSALFTLIAVVPDQPCTTPQDLGLNDRGDCLRLQPQVGPANWPDRLMPLLLPVLAGLSISIPAGMLLARRVAAPLRIIGAGMADLAKGDLRRSISADLRGSDAELAALGRAFDEAAARLQSLSESRERLFHDISHEIRSPLARLKAALGVLSVNPSRLAPMLARMGADIDRMSTLLEELLTFARIEHIGPKPRVLAAIDLVDLLDPIIADANFERQAHGISCRYDGPECLPLQADAEFLHRAFENIIRNALKFTRDASVIEVSARSGSDGITVEVRDRGPGADPAEIPGLFQPFVRGTRAPDRAGSGLGLAIAARAVAIHQGSISAENRAGGGLIVRIRLPRPPAPA